MPAPVELLELEEPVADVVEEDVAVDALEELVETFVDEAVDAVAEWVDPDDDEVVVLAPPVPEEAPPDPVEDAPPLQAICVTKLAMPRLARIRPRRRGARRERSSSLSSAGVGNDSWFMSLLLSKSTFRAPRALRTLNRLKRNPSLSNEAPTG